MAGPTFVLGGGQRCGTTWLYHLLDEHPQVYMAKPVRPEPKFFIKDQAPGADLEWYVRTFFSAVRNETAVGEKSTSYLETPGVARRMVATYPELKVVFILRHPVERAISNYRFSRLNGIEAMPMAEAFRTESSRLEAEPFAHLSAHPFAYLRRGRYAAFLSEFLEALPRRNVHVLLAEDLQERGIEVMRELYGFLGVDPSFRPSSLDRRFNETPSDDLDVDPALVAELLQHFEPWNRRLEKQVGRDVSRWDQPSPMIRAMMK